jgi:hypothetical protein
MKRMKTIGLASLLLLLAGAAATGHAQGTAPDTLALGRKYTLWFYSGQVDSLWAHHSEAAKKAMGSAKSYLDQIVEISAELGTEQQVLEERFVRRLGKTQYWRTATFSAASEPFMVRWAFGPNGEIEGLGLNPKSKAPPVDK